LKATIHHHSSHILFPAVRSRREEIGHLVDMGLLSQDECLLQGIPAALNNPTEEGHLPVMRNNKADMALQQDSHPVTVVDPQDNNNNNPYNNNNNNSNDQHHKDILLCSQGKTCLTLNRSRVRHNVDQCKINTEFHSLVVYLQHRLVVIRLDRNIHNSNCLHKDKEGLHLRKKRAHNNNNNNNSLPETHGITQVLWAIIR
jgi:hypothetical protein